MNITASQTSWMLLHAVPGQPACLDSRSPHKLPPEQDPRPVGPQKESVQPEAGCLSSQAPGAILLVAARISVSGRTSSASIRPPGSWPCHPSTLRLSRSSQPPSRRIAQPLLPPLPAAFCGRVRGYATDHARKTPCHIRTTINQLTANPRLFDPTFHFGSIRAVCAYAHVRLLPPLEPFAPQGAGSLLPLRRAARARGSACGRRRGAFPPDPRYCARVACRRRIQSQNMSPQLRAGVPNPSRIPRRQAFRSAPLSALLPSAAWTAQAGSRWGRLGRACTATRPKLRGSLSSDRRRHLSRRATPSLRALPSSRQALAAVGSYA
jgi:hypothetical protein